MKRIEYAEIYEGDVPGVIIRDGQALYEAGGKLWPVSGLVRNRDGGYLPVLDIPLMEERPAQRKAATA